MKDWTWRCVLVAIWVAITLLNLLSLLGHKTNWSWYFVVGISLFDYMLFGAMLWAIVKDMRQWNKSWRMLLVWLPGLFSERVRDWIIKEVKNPSRIR